MGAIMTTWRFLQISSAYHNILVVQKAVVNSRNQKAEPLRTLPLLIES